MLSLDCMEIPVLTLQDDIPLAGGSLSFWPRLVTFEVEQINSIWCYIIVEHPLQVNDDLYLPLHREKKLV